MTLMFIVGIDMGKESTRKVRNFIEKFFKSYIPKKFPDIGNINVESKLFSPVIRRIDTPKDKPPRDIKIKRTL